MARDRTARHDPGDRLTGRCRTWSRTIVVLAAAFPLLTIIAWLTGVAAITTVQPSLLAMQPGTALGLTLGAIAIFFTGDNRLSSTPSCVVRAIAISLSLFGLLTLAEY